MAGVVNTEPGIGWPPNWAASASSSHVAPPGHSCSARSADSTQVIAAGGGGLPGWRAASCACAAV